ncbi:MAG: beta-glucoside-specific PTS transporter subunit IIABC [Lachnospiraceae bacterium]|nr:beta-glucoside-specific PTS transporter subunit IIABC [Lachnospiraceae bacterium]
MAQVRDYTKLAKDIIVAVGGEENIVNAARCATRLRLVLKETPADAHDKIASMTGVITVVENGGQFQVVIGTHVGDVFDVVAKELHLDEKQSDMPEQKQSVLNRVIATMSAVFAPFIYILAAAGILQGVLIIVTMFAPSFANTGTYSLLSLMSWTPFTFLPIFIAVTASKHFKCNTFIALVCCCALVNPDLSALAGRVADGEVINFLCFKLSETTYTSSVLPPLFLVWILSYLERFVQKKLPDALKALFTPFICLIVMVPLTVLLIGPLSTLLANGIANGYNAIYNFAPALAAAVIGGVWQVIVIFGVHWGITPVVLANFANQGFDTFQAYQTMAVMAQMAAAFGVFIKSRNKEFKGVALSAGVTGIFGITEPAIYGVTLRLKKPFICGCIAGAAGAVTASLFHAVYYTYAGLPGVLTVVNALYPVDSTAQVFPMAFIGELIGAAVAIIGAIVLVQIVGFEDPVPAVCETPADAEAVSGMETAAAKAPANVSAAAEAPVSAKTPVSVKAPMTGKVIPLSEVADEVFSCGALGEGAAVEPADNKVYAPVDAKVESIFDTKHAIGLTTDNGMELLIHVGIDTVKLNGAPFTVKTSVGSRVKAGDLLLEFDAEAIKAAGCPLTTPVIITNPDDFSSIAICAEGSVNHGDEMIVVK